MNTVPVISYRDEFGFQAMSVKSQITPEKTLKILSMAGKDRVTYLQWQIWDTEKLRLCSMLVYIRAEFSELYLKKPGAGDEVGDSLLLAITAFIHTYF